MGSSGLREGCRIQTSRISLGIGWGLPGRGVAVILVPMLTRHRGSSLSAAVLLSALLLTACGGGTASEGGGDGGDQSEAEQDQQQEIEEAEAAREQALAGPSEAHREEAAQLVSELSLQQKAGQVLVGEYSSSDASDMAGLVQELHLAGAIVMGDNVPTGGQGADQPGADLAELETQLSSIQAAAEERGYPAMISVDQEGGLVTRVGEPLIEWPAPMAYGAAAEAMGGAGLTWQGHRFMGEELAELGFTASFAPNGDVTVGAADPTVGSRSFGSDPETVAELSLNGIRGLAEGGLMGSVKHFPGHGSVTDDSHHTLPVQDASLEELRARDWVPFAESIEAGVPMIMMGHIDVPALDDGVPSSLSSAAYDELREMGHDGVVVTDALNMGAIADGYGPDQAPVMALEAGADLLLMPADVRGAHEAIVSAVESGELSQDRLDEAAERVVSLLLWQQDLEAGELDAGPGVQMPEDLRHHYLSREEGLTEDEWLEDGAADGEPGSAEWVQSGAASVAEQLAAVSVTVVAGECGADQLEGGLQISGGTEQDRERLAAAAERAGVEVSGAGGTQVVLLGGGQPTGGGDVAVALDRPEALDGADAQTQIALYGRTAESFDALVAVLQGAEAPGALPVALGDFEAGHSACR